MLDLILTDISSYKSCEKLAPIANNDHCCILLRGEGNLPSRYVKKQKRLVTHPRKLMVLKDLAEQSWSSVLNAQDINSKVNLMHDTISKILDKHCPIKTTKVRVDKPPWMSAALEKAICAKNEAYRKGCPSHELLKTISQRLLRRNKRKFVSETLNKNQNTKAWWDTVKKLTNKSKQQQTSTHVIIDDTKLSNDTFCKNLNSYYVEVGGIRATSNSATVSSNTYKLDHLSLGEVKSLMRKLDKSKATSNEDFPTWISKEGIEDLVTPLHNIINCALDTNSFPDIWKKAQVVPIPKNKTPSTYKDYRPISLLFHLGKLLEQVIISKMKSHLAEVINSNQYAYQQRLSTTDAILQLIDDWTSVLDSDTNVKLIQNACLDFSKAFDRMQHPILISKMNFLGFNANVIALVESFLESRQQCVKYYDHFSEYKPIHVSAPQGTKLGPILWLIYVNDLTASDFNTKCIKYADDTTFYKPIVDPSTENISDAILLANTWSEQNNMILNSSKTVILNVAFTDKPAMHFDVNYGDDDNFLSPSEHTKFLGVVVDNTLTFSNHVDYIISKCSQRLYLMRLLKRMGMDSEGLKTFYVANIKSVVAYACPAWYNLLSDTDKTRLERIQRSATRIILPFSDDYQQRLDNLTLPTISTFLHTSCSEHFTKIANDNHHPLNSRINVNTNRTSARRAKIDKYRPSKCRTTKRQNTFFEFYMRFFN